MTLPPKSTGMGWVRKHCEVVQDDGKVDKSFWQRVADPDDPASITCRIQVVKDPSLEIQKRGFHQPDFCNHCGTSSR